MINLNRIFYFYTFVTKSTVMAASKELNICQPAVSRQLKLLEDELGIQLFDRRDRNLKLTEKGEHLFIYAKEMMKLNDLIKKDICEQTETNDVTPIKILVSEQLERPFSVQFISNLIRQNQSLQNRPINIRSGDYPKDDFDLILSNLPMNEGGFTIAGKLEMPVVLAVPKKLLLGKKESDIFNDIGSGKIPLSLPSMKFQLRQEIDQFLFSKGLQYKIAYESDLLAVVARTVADGFGATFLPFPYVREGSRTKTLQILGMPEGYWTQNIWLMNRTKPSHDIFEYLKTAFSSSVSDLDYI